MAELYSYEYIKRQPRPRAKRPPPSRCRSCHPPLSRAALASKTPLASVPAMTEMPGKPDSLNLLAEIAKAAER
jgi:hypothetical protein